MWSSRRTQLQPAVLEPVQSRADRYQDVAASLIRNVGILKALPSPLHFTLVLTCAATALRASEILALRWRDVLWNEGRIGEHRTRVRPREAFPTQQLEKFFGMSASHFRIVFAFIRAVAKIAPTIDDLLRRAAAYSQLQAPAGDQISSAASSAM
jgi:integrase